MKKELTTIWKARATPGLFYLPINFKTMTFEHILINLRRELIRTFAVMDEWFDKTNSLRRFKPSDKSWSINEVLEHVMLTNHYLLITVDRGRAGAWKKSDALGEFKAPDQYKLSTSALHELIDPEAIAWQCHEHHQPLGKRLPSEIRRELRSHLERCLVTLEMLPHGEGILHQTPVTFNDIGRLDVYQQLYFIVLHAQRHLHQMKKIGEEFEVGVSV